jgi:hypothetical protein
MKYPKNYTNPVLTDYAEAELIEGERIEDKVRRLMDEKSPINDGAPIIYTERKDGVLPAYDIRTDRWEIAQKAMEENMKAISAKRKHDYDAVLTGEKKDVMSGDKNINGGATEASA